MTNPWLKKNPFMSLWLSTAHRMAGAIRGQAAAHAKRQSAAAMHAGTLEAVRQWCEAVAPVPAPAPARKTTARKR